MSHSRDLVKRRDSTRAVPRERCSQGNDLRIAWVRTARNRAVVLGVAEQLQHDRPCRSSAVVKMMPLGRRWCRR